MIKAFKQYYGNIQGYPTNTRFSQRLADLGVTAGVYFEAISDIQKELATSLYAHFYSASIALEELDIFDIKIKQQFKNQCAIYEPRIAAQIEFYNSAKELSSGAEKTVYDENFGKGTQKTMSANSTINNNGNSESSAYQQVSEANTTETSKTESNTTDRYSGQDTHTGSVTVERSLKGDVSFIEKLNAMNVDLIAEFCDNFNYLFMGIL